MNRCLIATALLLLSGLSAPAISQEQADAHYDPAVMARARDALHRSHGGGTYSMVFIERAEYQSGDGDPTALWEAQGWLGNDIHKLWFKTEGEHGLDPGDLEEFELQALYSRAIHAFWDLQAGIRYDIEPNPSRTFLAVGLQGLAPYWFELDLGLFLSDQADVSARLEAEYEFRLTQRLLLQPRAELNFAFSDDTATEIGSGLSTVEAGVRLRYEFKRQFAPYVGISWEKAFGDTADLLGTKDRATTTFIAGIRIWF